MTRGLLMAGGFGQRLKELRERAGLTQQGVAVAAGLSVSNVAKLERNEVKPSWDTVVRLAKALRAKTDDFLDDDEPPGDAEEPAKPKRRT